MDKRLIFSIILLFTSCTEDFDSEAYANPTNCITINYSNNIAYVDEEPFTGSCIVYSSDNRKIRLISFRKGIQNGPNVGYYPNQNIEYKGFRKNGEIHGQYTRYHPNGNININGKMKKGYRVGKWEFLSEEGILEKQVSFLKGKAVDSIIYSK